MYPHIEYLNVGEANWGWNGPGWYFWDESEAYCHGPYESQEAANNKLHEYYIFLDREDREFD